ncbi:MAG: hypothetical protein HC802_22830, partial [Caldilineaceae bacterium]|nr:hypothetical protein [Caldilineaceae bacterium]
MGKEVNHGKSYAGFYHADTLRRMRWRTADRRSHAHECIGDSGRNGHPACDATDRTVTDRRIGWFYPHRRYVDDP